MAYFMQYTPVLFKQELSDENKHTQLRWRTKVISRNFDDISTSVLDVHA